MPDLPPTDTLLTAWTGARDRLKQAQIDSPVIDARILVEAACEATRTDIIADPYRAVSPEQMATLSAYLDRRERREPVARIIGRKGFWKIMLNVDSNVLIPRPDTEVVVDMALKSTGEADALRILDLGVGSGAIILSILAERPGATGLGIDVSEEALAVARENASQLGLEGRLALLRGDWTWGLGDGGFDIVVSNPPYIASDEIETLEPEVKHHEPRLALDGGPDGLDAYRTLAPEILRVLKPGGLFLVEIGWTQAQAVTALFKAAGASDLATVKDLADRDRVVMGRRNPLES